MKNRLKELRKNSNLSQEQMAQIVGVVKSAICQYEIGTRQMPDEAKIKCADYFGVSIDYLIGRTENSNISFPDIYPNLSPELLAQLNALTPEQQEKVIVFIKGMLA